MIENLKVGTPDWPIIEVSGGCVTEVHGPVAYELLDWDNLLGDVYTRGDCKAAWDQFGPQMKAWITTKYPSECEQIQQRIAEDEAA